MAMSFRWDHAGCSRREQRKVSGFLQPHSRPQTHRTT
jgi:hypothetical protein